MWQYLLFFLVIALANIMQGITGFAGTILAMPFSLMLVGYPVAKPVLNVLAIFSGGYVCLGHRKDVDKKVLWQVVGIMFLGMIAGFFIKDLFEGKEQILTRALGVFVILLALEGFYETFRRRQPDETKEASKLTVLLLPLAGIVHGIFVSGGPLLIGYLSKRLKDRHAFRATISTVWIILNSVVLIDDCIEGYWSGKLLLVLLCALPFLFLGMKIGSILYKKMDHHTFMIITYILLFISGMSLLLK